MKGLPALFAIVVLWVFMYGCYWVAKTVSYSLFYADMVEETIQETVKPECLLR